MAGSFSEHRVARLRGTLLLGLLAALLLCGGWWSWRKFMNLRDDVLFRAPTENEVAQYGPELLIQGARFHGIWADFDRGAVVYEYANSAEHQVLEALENQLRAAGWETRGTRGANSVWERMTGSTADPKVMQARLRHAGHGVTIAVFLSPASPTTTTAIGDPRAEAYFDRSLRKWLDQDRGKTN